MFLLPFDLSLGSIPIDREGKVEVCSRDRDRLPGVVDHHALTGLGGFTDMISINGEGNLCTFDFQTEGTSLGFVSHS